MRASGPASVKHIERRILLIRGQRVMLDSDLADLYGVSTKVLNQSVKRNRGRFPYDFMFQLNEEEKDEVITICDHLRSLRFSHALKKLMAVSPSPCRRIGFHLKRT